MSVKNFIIICTSIGVLIIGCNTSETGSSPSYNIAAENQSLKGTDDFDLQKLIKNASLRFKTADVEETYDFVKKATDDFGAFISQDNNFNYSAQVGYELTIKVPSDKFDSLLNYIIDNANIRSLETKSVQIKDVTEEFIDIEARLKIKKESHQKLSELLKQAKNLTETLEIHKQLTDLQADIESIEGRLQYLSDQVDYSIINLFFYETPRYTIQFFNDFLDALKEGWQVFLHLIIYLTYLWVIILATLIIILSIRFYRRRDINKK